MSENNKLNDIIRTSLDSIRSMVDSNTVIGNPIETPNGTTVIPVSKISVGFASGGIDYNDKKTPQAAQNFGGGGGSGVSVVPVAFLVVHADGSVEMMNVSNPTSKPADLGYNVSSLVERAPEIIEKIKAMIPKKKKKDESAADEAPAVSEEQTEEAKDASEEEVEHEFLDTSL